MRERVRPITELVMLWQCATGVGLAHKFYLVASGPSAASVGVAVRHASEGRLRSSFPSPRACEFDKSSGAEPLLESDKGTVCS